MSKKQILRAYRKLFESVTRGNGYQPWGYDVPTMRITNPGFFPAKERLASMYRSIQE